MRMHASNLACMHAHLPFCLRREVFVTDDSVCFVMEYANGGNLFDLVRKQKRLRETQARWFFQQLILAIDYCHRRGEGSGAPLQLQQAHGSTLSDLAWPLPCIPRLQPPCTFPMPSAPLSRCRQPGHQAGELPAPQRGGPAAPAAQAVRLWLLQGRLPLCRQDASRDALVHGARGGPEPRHAVRCKGGGPLVLRSRALHHAVRWVGGGLGAADAAAASRQAVEFGRRVGARRQGGEQVSCMGLKAVPSSSSLPTGRPVSPSSLLVRACRAVPLRCGRDP